MSCCDGPEYARGWEKAVAAEGLCFRFIRVKRVVYMDDDVVPPGDYIVRCPTLRLTFRVREADFLKYFQPLMAESEHAS